MAHQNKSKTPSPKRGEFVFSTELLRQRSSGLLMHVSSLPGPYGIGDVGVEARRFVDFCARAGQKFWQMLPVNPIGAGHSPYSSVSSFAGDPLFVSPDELFSAGLITASERRAARVRGADRRTNYPLAARKKHELLRRAYSRFRRGQKWERFAKENRSWLDTYAFFSSLAKHFGTRDWSQWPAEVRDPTAATCRSAQRALAEEIDYFKFEQFIFDQQWQTLRAYATARGVYLIGDIPIFVPHQSADVWGGQKYFWLRADGRPQFVAGVPPDYFNKDGQLWGNALYRWDQLKREGFSWWKARIKRQMHLFDLIRIDHFIGLHRYWEIPAAAKNARRGHWRLVPGRELLGALKREAGGELRLIAEDLGLLTPEVVAMRQDFGLLGMKVLQFGFARDGSSPSHLSYNFNKDFVVYTGTHDNPTTVGWFDEAYGGRKRSSSSYDYHRIAHYLACTRRNVHEKLCWEAMKSVAQLCILPVQDVIGLDGSARMNLPGKGTGQWEWRLKAGALTPQHAKRLSAWTELSGRV